jgi:hypothetical protein
MSVTNHTMPNLEDTIIGKIKAGELDMKPRWHFVLRAAFYAVATALVALTTIYLVSFIVFLLRQTGAWFALEFGIRGLGLFVLASPWLLIVLTALFLVLLYLLVKHYAFSYQRPLVYSMLGVVAVALVGGALIERTPMHERMQAISERHQVPGFMPLYQQVVERRPEAVTVGRVRAQTETGCQIVTRDGEVLTVVTTSRTRQKPTDACSANNTVVVLGSRQGDTITAVGLRVPPENWRGPRPPRVDELRALPGDERAREQRFNR